MPSSHLILCCPLLLLPSIPLSIRVFSNESTLLMRWPKYLSFSFSIIPSKVFLLKNIMVLGWAGHDHDEISTVAVGLALLGSTWWLWGCHCPPLAGRSCGTAQLTPSTCWCPLTPMPWAPQAIAWPFFTAEDAAFELQNQVQDPGNYLTCEGCTLNTLTPFPPGHPALPSTN